MKKRILAGAAALCLAGSSLPVQAVDFTADLTGDGTLTCIDAIAMQKYLLGLDTLTKSQRAAADMNLDGRVNAFDAALLKRSLLDESAPARYGRIGWFDGTSAYWDAAWAGESFVIATRAELEAWTAEMLSSEARFGVHLLETYDEAYFETSTLYLHAMTQGGSDCTYDITNMFAADGILQIQYADVRPHTPLDVEMPLLGEASVPKSMYSGHTAAWTEIAQNGRITSWSEQEVPVAPDALPSGEGFMIQTGAAYLKFIEQCGLSGEDCAPPDLSIFTDYTLLVLPCGLQDASDQREIRSIIREDDAIVVDLDVVEQETLGGCGLYMVYIPKTDAERVVWNKRYLTALPDSRVRVESLYARENSYAPYNRYAGLFDNADDFRRFLRSFAAQAIYEYPEVMHAMIEDPDSPFGYTCITIELPTVRAWKNGVELALGDTSWLQDLMEAIPEQSLETNGLLTTEDVEAHMENGYAVRVTYSDPVKIECGSENIAVRELFLLTDGVDAQLAVVTDEGTRTFGVDEDILYEILTMAEESEAKDRTLEPDVDALEALYDEAFFEEYRLVAVHDRRGAEILSLAPEVDNSSCLSMTLRVGEEDTDPSELLLAAIPIKDCPDVTHLFVAER